MLGAVNGTLTAPRPVLAQRALVLSQPLFDHAVSWRGAYGNAGAERTTFAPQDAPFALALPAPKDADTSQLGGGSSDTRKMFVTAPRNAPSWESASG